MLNYKESEKTIDELLSEKGNKPVYILNTTENKDVIILQLYIPGTSKTLQHKIHGTWIPQQLFPVLPKKIILESHDLRAYINKGLISVVDTEWAVKELSGKDAIYEMQKLNISNKSLSHTDQDKDKSISLAESIKESGEMSEETPESPEDKINPGLRSNIIEFNSGSIEVRDFISNLRNLKGKLNEDDFHYILSNVDNNQAKELAKSWLAAGSELEKVYS